MIYYQKWEKSTFEYSYLEEIKPLIKSCNNIYIGFDYGFFSGIEIFYGSLKSNKLAFKLNDELKNKKIKVKVCCNIPYDFDLIVLLGYTNNIKEINYLKKNKKKIFKSIQKAIN